MFGFALVCASDYDNFGFDENGVHFFTHEKYDHLGFNREGTIHKKTGTRYSDDGFDCNGYDKYNRYSACMAKLAMVFIN